MSYIPGSSGVVGDFNRFYYDAYRTYGTYYAAAYRDLRAYAGDNWTDYERTKLERQKRMVLELNKIRRVVNLYSGYERENRTQTVVAPVEDSDVITADQLSNLMYYAYNKANADYIISDAFDHALKTGLSIVGLYMDYSVDKFDGDIKMYWKPFNALMLDPYFTKRDLSDCDQASTRDLLSREMVKSLLPWIDPKIIDQLPCGIRDNKYQYLGIYRQYNSTYIAQNLLTYDQYWVRKTKRVKYLVDRISNIAEEIKDDAEEKRIRENLYLTPQSEIIEDAKRTVELNIIVGGQLLYQGPDPTELDTFPFVPIITYFEPLIDQYSLRIQGIVRSIRDAQRQYNRRHSQIIDLMESVINSGYITRNGAVLDPSMLFQAGQGKHIVINENYDVNADIKEISPPNIPPGYLNYQDILDKNILEIPGASDELLGISSVGDSQVSGRLAEVRASNGLKGNRGLFDNLEQSKKYLGKIFLQCMQKNYSYEKVQRIIGQQPTEQFLTKTFQEYDCVIKQAVKTATQREAYYYQLIQLVQLGAPIEWSDILEAAPIQGETKILENVRRNQEQQRELAQRAQELEDAQTQLTLSHVDENTALASERRARVLADIGLAKERISEQTQNYAKALLDNAKTVKEIQDLDRKRLIDVLKLAAEIKAAETKNVDAELAKDAQRVKNLE